MLVKTRKDFKFFEKTFMEEICIMCGERLFQAQGAATENERSLSVEYVAQRWTATVPTSDQLCCWQ